MIVMLFVSVSLCSPFKLLNQLTDFVKLGTNVILLEATPTVYFYKGGFCIAEETFIVSTNNL
jgi:hypothetical protein